MAIPGWRTALVVQGVDLRQGRRAPVVVGLVERIKITAEGLDE